MRIPRTVSFVKLDILRYFVYVVYKHFVIFIIIV